MGIVKQQFGTGATYQYTSFCVPFSLPDFTAAPSQWYSQTDLTGLSAADVLVSGKGWAWPWTVCFTVTDDAGSDLDIDVSIDGIDHRGNRGTESITGIGDGITQSTKVYQYIYSITLDAITAGAAADVLNIGTRSCTSSDSAGDYGTFALPPGVEKDGDILGIYTGNVERIGDGGIVVDATAGTATFDTVFNANQQIGFFALDCRLAQRL